MTWPALGVETRHTQKNVMMIYNSHCKDSCPNMVSTGQGQVDYVVHIADWVSATTSKKLTTIGDTN